MTVTETLRNEENTILWVGSEGGMEKELVQRANLPFKAIPAAGVHGVSIGKLPGNIWKLWKGFQRSKQIIKEFSPDVLFFTGGYVAIPMALAGLEKQALLYVPDIEPGLALKVLARFSDRIAVTEPESRNYFRNQEKVYVTGYPLREDLMKWNRKDALEYFQFSDRVPTLLFMGGSSGARSINNAVLEIVGPLLENYQVIHLTGHLDWETVRMKTAHLGSRYQAFPYLHEMGAALAAADLVISRAGASILGEYPYFGLPAILVPYPYAWRYQKLNADYLVERKAAVLLEDSRLRSDLLTTITDLMNNPERLGLMRSAMAALSQPKAAENIAALLFEMAGG